jgi:hypothetical protein
VSSAVAQAGGAQAGGARVGPQAQVSIDGADPVSEPAQRLVVVGATLVDERDENGGW